MPLVRCTSCCRRSRGAASSRRGAAYPAAFGLVLIANLTPATRSADPILHGVFLPVHATFAFFGYAALFVAFTAGVLYLIQERELKSRAASFPESPKTPAANLRRSSHEDAYPPSHPEGRRAGGRFPAGLDLTRPADAQRSEPFRHPARQRLVAVRVQVRVVAAQAQPAPAGKRELRMVDAEGALECHEVPRLLFRHQVRVIGEVDEGDAQAVRRP